MQNSTEKKVAAFLSIASNTLLILLKIIAGYVSGSISIISEAFHSMNDLIASTLAFFSVSKSAKPADKEHQFGHGKYEDFAGLFEGILIMLASFYILYEAAEKIFITPKEALNTNIAMAVMLFSVFVNIFVSTYLLKVAKKTDSIVLLGDAEHLRSDIYSSLAIFLGLFVIKITGIRILDPIIAIIVALFILSIGYNISKKSANNLLDGTLPEEEINIIEDVMKNCIQNYNIKLKNIKTRKSGITRQIELTLLVDPNKSVRDGHKLCDEIENKINEKLLNSSFLIHLEPFEEN